MKSEKFKNMDSVICQEATNSLLSVSEYTNSNNAAIVFTNSEAYGVRRDDQNNSLLSNIKDHSSQSNQLILTANINNDNL